MKGLSKLRERRIPVSEDKDTYDNSKTSLGKLNPNHSSGMPNARWYSNGDAYFHYRAMVMVASLPDPPRIKSDSFSADQPFSVSYTKAEDDMIAMAAKLCGFPGKKLSGPKSTESDGIHKISPVSHNSGKN